MIVVRRSALEPVAPVEQARPEDDRDDDRGEPRSRSASKPCIRNWSGKRGFACENWKSDWLNHSPIEALTAIQVGASSQTWEERRRSR